MTPSRTPLRDRIARKVEPVAVADKPEPVRKPAWLRNLQAKDFTGRLA